jgi:hypothetical protein
MIAYDIQCVNGHAFEGWFEDSEAYEAQKKKELIACPVCNNTRVSRIPSTFAIFDDVGCDFAKEALKIHYGVEEPRNIRGVSTKEEEKMLKKEGVDFVKIPMPAPPDTDA